MIETVFSFGGRPPNWQPSPEFVLDAFSDFIAANPVIGKILSDIKTGRSEKGCTYTNLELLWTSLVGNVMRYSSKHQFDQDRNTNKFLSQTILNLAGRPYVKDDPNLFTACSQTIVNLMKKIDPEEMQKAQIELIRHFMRAKLFDLAKLNGYFCVAVDATVKDRKFNRASDPVDPSHRNRYVIEAKILTPWGWANSIVSEPIEPYNSEKGKQDSELAGFKRMAKKLRKAFPRCPICIIGDALYHCQSVRKICEDYHWQYIFTAKEGRAPELFKAFKAEIDANPKQAGKVIDKYNKIVESLRWASGEMASHAMPYTVTCDFVEICETDSETKAAGYEGAFATSFEITCKEQARRIVFWGRKRWNIENSFKVMKHDGYGLEHTFCLDERVSSNLYVMMTMAYTLWQIFCSGFEARMIKKVRKTTRRDLAEKLKRGILGIGILKPLVNRGARLSRAYMDEWRLHAA